MQRQKLIDKIFSLRDPDQFEPLALEVFRYQYSANPLYRTWADALGRSPALVHDFLSIPFLPIELFKTHRVKTGEFEPELRFTSSGTTGSVTSVHEVRDAALYKRSFLEGFKLCYGLPESWQFLCLLPSYLERSGSSLIYMCKELTKLGMEGSGFYLNNLEDLMDALQRAASENGKVMLIGVSFALLDFSEMRPPVWDNLVVVETGGMKGRRREMIREELHATIRNKWPVKQIHSEYGMTELLSQAWRISEEGFRCPPWMRVVIRETTDPFSTAPVLRSGGMDVCDLANVDSVSFIRTSDMGKMSSEGFFEVIGRYDNSDVRGCNLMIS